MSRARVRRSGTALVAFGLAFAVMHPGPAERAAFSARATPAVPIDGSLGESTSPAPELPVRLAGLFAHASDAAPARIAGVVARAGGDRTRPFVLTLAVTVAGGTPAAAGTAVRVTIMDGDARLAVAGSDAEPARSVDTALDPDGGARVAVVPGARARRVIIGYATADVHATSIVYVDGPAPRAAGARGLPVVAAPTASAAPAATGAPAALDDVSSDLSDRFYAFVKAKRYADAIATGRAYLARRPDDQDVRLDLAYTESNDGDRRAAEDDFVIVLAHAPERSDVRLDLAYLQIDRKEHAAAIASLATYLRAKPADDDARLALAYEDDDAGDGAAAMALFTQLRRSPDAKIARTATSELTARTLSDARDHADRFQLDAYAQDEGRYAGDLIGGADLRYNLTPPTRFQPYLIAHLATDTLSGRSSGLPQIYEDRALVLDAGVRTQLGRTGVYAFAEAGTGIGLNAQGTISDLRYGLLYSKDVGTDRRGFTDLDGSVVTYSRYVNTISYLEGAHDFPLAGRLHGVYGANAAFDVKRDYGNNYLEAFAGLQVASRDRSFIARLLAVQGSYLSRGIGNPGSLGYFTLRPQLLYSRSF